MTRPTVPPRRPLLVTGDQALRDSVLQTVAVGGTDVDVATDVWGADGCPIALLGGDLAASLLAPALRVAREVVVVSLTADGDPSVGAVATAHGVPVLRLPEAAVTLRQQVERSLSAPDVPVVAVVGGKGGAGASVLACALAVTAATGGARVVLVDADPLGGGLDLTMGIEAVPGLRWPDLAGATGALPPAALLANLPSVGGVGVVAHGRGPVPVGPAAMRAVLSAAARGCDLVVVDVGRPADETALAAVSAAGTAYVVVPTDLRAVAAARSTLLRLAILCPAVGLVVRDVGPAGLRPADVAELVGAQVVAELPTERGLIGRLARGVPPGADGRGPVVATARSLLARLDVPVLPPAGS